MRERRPESLHDAWLDKLAELTDDPAEALLKVYEHPDDHAELYRLADALADYDLRFAAWRFHHLMLVERVIGNRATGTGGSSGHGYLGRTLQYRFFPELWEARNRLTEKHAHQS
jgi:tryptophan 2,3-dioxygenase